MSSIFKEGEQKITLMSNLMMLKLEEVRCSETSVNSYQTTQWQLQQIIITTAMKTSNLSKWTFCVIILTLFVHWACSSRMFMFTASKQHSVTDIPAQGGSGPKIYAIHWRNIPMSCLISNGISTSATFDKYMYWNWKLVVWKHGARQVRKIGNHSY